MSYLYVKWNSSECGSVAQASVIRAWFVFADYSRNGGLRRHRRRVLAAVEGVASDRVGNSRTNGILANATAFAVCITSDFWIALEALKRN